MSKVKITSGMNPKSTRILIDDKPLEKAYSCEIRFSVDDAPKMKAEVFISSADIETDANCELFTYVNGKRYKLVEV